MVNHKKILDGSRAQSCPPVMAHIHEVLLQSRPRVPVTRDLFEVTVNAGLLQPTWKHLKVCSSSGKRMSLASAASVWRPEKNTSRPSAIGSPAGVPIPPPLSEMALLHPVWHLCRTHCLFSLVRHSLNPIHIRFCRLQWLTACIRALIGCRFFQ